MADMTLCTATNCPMASNCYRKQKETVNLLYQSYANYEYTCNENDGFSCYIKNPTNTYNIKL